MNCKECNDELYTVHEMDEYQMCDACYCRVFDSTNKHKEKYNEEINNRWI